MAAEQKTNAMRLVEQAGISYTPHTYPHGKDAVDGITVASLIGRDPAQVFKTLVTKGSSGNYAVFVIPVTGELDLKKAARAAGEKSVAMIPVADINKVTGYVRGGCSPVGLKKPYPIYLDETAILQETIIVSAGKIGQQIELAPDDLLQLVNGSMEALTKD